MPARSPLECLAAWLITGPVGHLVAGVADLGALGARLARGRLTRR